MKKILILENGKSINNAINHLLTDEEYEIIFADNSFIKDSQLPKQIPDMVIADLTSIKNEKVELLMQLKSNPVISLIPFLLIISGNGIGSDKMYSANNYYLKRPFTNDVLITLIKKILNHTRSLSPW